MVLTALTAAIGIAAQAQDYHRVTVYVRDSASVPVAVKLRAKLMAGAMFSRIGIQIDWRTGEPSLRSPDSAMAIELVTNTSSALMPGAFAYAMPYEGVHIQVFYDRLTSSSTRAELLAHVLVHEITHILEGVDCHSESGVMKAHWTEEEVEMMRSKALPFAEEDVIRIRYGKWGDRSRESRALAAGGLSAQLSM